MRQFNRNVGKVLEAIDLDLVDPRDQKITPEDQRYVAHVIETYKQGDISAVRAGDLLRNAITKETENRPLNAVADFVDILNNKANTGHVVNTSVLRKLARSLGILPNALDTLDQKDQAIAIKLIERSVRRGTSKTRTPASALTDQT